jgi:hypothetical protein
VEYVIVLVGGVICGFIVPSNKKAIVGLFTLGVVFLLAMVIVAETIYSYDSTTIWKMLMLTSSPNVERPGVMQLGAGGYCCILGALVVGVRSLFAGSERTEQ